MINRHNEVKTKISSLRHPYIYHDFDTIGLFETRGRMLMKYVGKTIGITATRDHLVIWANDHHTSPIHDLKSVLVPLNVSIIDMTMSNHCHITKTCQNKLKVLNKQNSIDLLEANIITKFYDYYKNDALMKTPMFVFTLLQCVRYLCPSRSRLWS